MPSTSLGAILRRNAVLNVQDFLRRTELSEESGQALAEYSLLLTFIAAVCVLAVTALGIAIAGGFGSILPAF
jgi:Flp pilus assembly pilin Flp